ncbi:MAG: ATP-binding protein [Parcubacteria group bacterium]|nr:ATP-binding protein [Parcubacteria group bacterium]
MSPIANEKLRDMEEKFKLEISNQFLIWGNITDYLPQENGSYISLKKYLREWLSDKMDIIIFYDIGGGISFASEEQEALFRERFPEFKKPEPTIDPEQLKKYSPEKQREIKAGMEQLENMPEPELPSKPQIVLKMIEELMQNALPKKTRDEKSPEQHRVALIVEYAEVIAPAEASGALAPDDRVNTVMLRRLAMDENISKESIVILLVKNLTDIHSSIRGRGSRLKAIEIPLPQKEARSHFVSSIHSVVKGKIKMSSDDFGHNTGGLTLREIEDVCIQSKTVTHETISNQKSIYLEEEFGDILKIMKPRFGLNGIGGLEHIKQYFLELRDALHKGDARLVPPAVLLMGPPGTCKTALAEAMAYEWGVPFVEILNTRSMWHGVSESITLRVMFALQALYPCVVFWDEFDQEESPRGSYQGDSGISSRLRKIRFQMTSDPKNRGKFLIIYSTNRPDLVDPADKRSGRASARIPMLLPDLQEQVKIFQVMPPRYQFETDVKDFNRLTNTLIKTHGNYISGADIEEISLTAFSISAKLGHRKVKEEDYLYAIDDFVPHHYAATEISALEELAVRERSSNRFLSKRGLEIVGKLKNHGDGYRYNPTAMN